MRFCPIPIVSSGNKPLSFRQQMAWSEASTRPVSADSSIGDGPQHICWGGRFVPADILYGKTLKTYLHGKCLPGTLIYMGFCYSGHTMGAVSKVPTVWVCDTLSFSGYYKPLFCFPSVHLTEEPFSSFFRAIGTSFPTV